MNRELRERRDRAVARHDTALSGHPTRQGPGFAAELKAVVDELTAVAAAADAPTSDAVEVAKTYRWLGDAYFDLGLGSDQQLLTRGARAYARADELLARADAPVEKAKLDFNYANTLRGLSGGVDVGLLEAAQTRYESAARTFRSRHLADLAATVDESKRTLDPQLQLARNFAAMHKGQARLAEMGKLLETANAVERDRIAQEVRDLGDELRRGGVQAALDEAIDTVRGQFAAHAERVAPDDAQKLDSLAAQPERLSGALRPPLATPPAEAKGAAAGGPLHDVADALLERLRSDTAAGKVPADRASAIGDVFQRFTAAMSEGGDDLASLASRADRMRALIRQAMDIGASPSWSTRDPAPGSRAHRLLAIIDPLKRHLIAEQGRSMQPSEERSASLDLLGRMLKLEVRIRELAPDERNLGDPEAELWRIAEDVLEYARRYHLMLARPIFPTASTRAEPRTVFVSGGHELHEAARRLETVDGLHFLERARRGDVARERWNQLCSAGVAVFDVGVTDPVQRAQACYELGLALAIGKPSVVATRGAQKPPFNVELQPILVTGDADDDAERLRGGIVQALSSVVWGGSEAHLGRGPADALAWLDGYFGRRLSEGTTKIAADLARASCDDAVAFRRTLEQLLGALGGDAPAVILPAWPPAYPSAASQPHLFHVMPFGPAWAKSTRDAAEEVCHATGWTYSRGDEADEQRVIRGIWTEIGRASAVLVDVTGANPNVALELGLVHALGRPYRIVTRDEVGERLFPSLEKLQVHSYRRRGFHKEVSALLSTSRRIEEAVRRR